MEYTLANSRLSPNFESMNNTQARGGGTIRAENKQDQYIATFLPQHQLYLAEENQYSSEKQSSNFERNQSIINLNINNDNISRNLLSNDVILRTQTDQKHNEFKKEQNSGQKSNRTMMLPNNAQNQDNKELLSKSFDYFNTFQMKFQNLIQSLEQDEQQRIEMEKKNSQLRTKIFNTMKNSNSVQSNLSIEQQTPSARTLNQSIPQSNASTNLCDSNQEQHSYKDKLISQLSIENRYLKQELQEANLAKLQLESDLNFLKQTLEDQLPYFNEIEQANKQLSLQLSQKQKQVKSVENSSIKVRELEQKLKTLTKDYEKEKWRIQEDSKQLKERLDAVRKMNFHLQKLLSLNKKKADQADNLIKRCIELEKSNQKMVSIILFNESQGKSIGTLQGQDQEGLLNEEELLRQSDEFNKYLQNCQTQTQQNESKINDEYFQLSSKNQQTNQRQLLQLQNTPLSINVEDDAVSANKNTNQSYKVSPRSIAVISSLKNMSQNGGDDEDDIQSKGNKKTRSKQLQQEDQQKQQLDDSSQQQKSELPSYVKHYLQAFGDSKRQDEFIAKEIKASFTEKDKEYLMMEYDFFKNKEDNNIEGYDDMYLLTLLK